MRIDLTLAIVARCVRVVQVRSIAARVFLIEQVAVSDRDAALNWWMTVWRLGNRVFAAIAWIVRSDQVAQRFAGKRVRRLNSCILCTSWPRQKPIKPFHIDPANGTMNQMT